MYFPERTRVAIEKGNPRGAWTVLHEVGHIAFRANTTRNRSTSKTIVERVVPTIRIDERVADKFAAAFLAPYHKAEFTTETTVEDIVQRFGLSRKAAEYRLKEFDSLYRHQHKTPRKVPLDVTRYLAEGRAKGYRVRSLSYEGPVCTVCGAPALFDIGSTKATCASCHTSGDKYQDGDTI
jgi:Zn-dependent peptidase ImmA (M78 family)